MTLYLLHFNNYYNRKVIRYETLNEYTPYVLQSFYNITNFTPADGIQTTQIINYHGDIPDYCLVCNEYNEIVSRWYIIEATRTRAQQYEIMLYRDVIADYFYDIINAPTYIEKATLSADNPLIYNKENFSVNQIKTNEVLLKDESGAAWIVGYLARQSTTEELSATFTYDPQPSIVVNNLSEWEYYSYTNGQQAYHFDNASIEIYYDTDSDGFSKMVKVGLSANNSGYETYNVSVNNNPSYNVGQAGLVANSYYPLFAWKTNVEQALPRIAASLGIQNATYNKLSAYYQPANVYDGSEAIYNALFGLNDRIIKDNSTGKMYRIQFEKYSLQSGTANVGSGTLYNDYNNMINTLNTSFPREIFSGNSNVNTFKVFTRYSKYGIKLWELEVVDYTDTGMITLGTDRLPCSDAPYDMFCIPYADVDIYKNGVFQFTQSKEVSLAAASALTTKYSGGNSPILYDLQLLPFSPVPYYIQDGKIDYGNTAVGTIVSNDQQQGVVFYPKNSKFTTSIAHNIFVNNDPIEKKIQNECDLYRICSPNYNSIFEFSVVKNEGVRYFNVDCTYMPITPYIHVNPNFGGLYGEDFDDPRGLICSGEFSLPMTSSAWEAYRRENKNLIETFDRQIENLEVQHDIQRERESWQILSGTFGGVVGGAVAGSMAGGPIGAIAGGVVGGAASLIGGRRDIALNERLRNETIDYTRDQFGYQLGNIKALANTLTRTTAFTNNNKIFPILEYYTCTEVEKEAFRNKLKYNGMSVGVIGKISDYLRAEKTYIKGKIIRLDDIAEDYQVANVVAAEINKGVFI